MALTDNASRKSARREVKEIKRPLLSITAGPTESERQSQTRHTVTARRRGMQGQIENMYIMFSYLSLFNCSVQFIVVKVNPQILTMSVSAPHRHRPFE